MSPFSPHRDHVICGRFSALDLSLEERVSRTISAPESRPFTGDPVSGATTDQGYV